MAIITARINITQTVNELNAANMDAVFQWVKTNVIDKLPQTATKDIKYEAVP